MKRKILFALSLFVFVLSISTSSYAVKAKKSGKIYQPPASVPASFNDVTYVTGIPEIDVRKYTDYAQASGRFDLNEKGAIFYKTQIDQKKGKGLESVEYFKIPYSDIKELYFGYDAIFKAANDALPTALKTIYDRGGWPVFSARALPLHVYMKKRLVSPVVIFYMRGKTLTSLVLMTRDGPAKAIYTLLAKQAGIKVKEPMTMEEGSNE